MLRPPAQFALLSVLVLAACDTGLVLTPPEGAGPDDPQPTTAIIQITTGENQEGAAGLPLAEPVVVTVTAPDGTALGGVPVLWAFEDGRGRPAGASMSWASVASTTSDAQGRASVQWQLGQELGSQRAAVRVGATTAGSAPVIFSATAVAGPPTALTISPDQLTLGLGESLQLLVSGTDAFGHPSSTADVVWSSDTPVIASVSPSGLVSAAGAGQTAVIASLGGVQGEALVTVEVGTQQPEPGSLQVVQGNGQSGQVVQQLGQSLKVRLRDTSGQPMQGRVVSWSVQSGDGSVSATTSGTDAAGLAEIGWTLGSSAGTQSVRASTSSLSPVTFSATALAAAAADLAVTPAQSALDPGQTLQLAVTGTDGFGNAVSTAATTWSSSAPSVATVSGDGLVSAIAAGQTAITVMLDGAQDVASVTVDGADPEPEPEPETLEIVQGNDQNGQVARQLDQTLKVRLRDAGGQPMPGQAVTWSILSGAGALSTTTTTTDASGLGETIWTLGSSPGAQSVRASVPSLSPVIFSATAVAGPLATLTVTPAQRTLDPGQKVQLSVSGVDAFGNAVSTADVSWNSGSPGIASVSGSGLVTAVAAGQSSITASDGGIFDGALVTVNAPPPPPPPPSGQTVFFEEGFENSQFASRGWYDNVSMTRSTSEKHSGSSALEVRFNSGQELPTFGGSARHLVEGTESMYVRYWVKYSSNWIGSGVGYHPHEFQILTNKDGQYSGPASTHLTTYIETRHEGGAIRPLLSIGDRLNINAASIGDDLTGITENRAVAGCNGNTDGYATGCYNAGSQWANEKIWLASGSSISKGSCTWSRYISR